MKKSAVCLIMFILVLISGLCVFAPSYAQPVSSGELINNPSRYDGKTIVYGGEIIGDIMKRGGYAWINVSDGNAIGVWVPLDLLKEINFSGNYKAAGDNIEIVGIFNAACKLHGGDLDIHAQAIRKISPGGPREEKVNTEKGRFALILAGILFLIWILTLFMRK